ncbi:MAG TPA: bifunctional phosphoribosyl-AMP cyclohydrolase/phosphoribosyl-ATP diphosphatase HisIE [Vitreimonas sp.]|uniref:bifunctional phosphoribosyl-AMP cyclohydrolase/phosphoribosyl-ATP diphosphatase HisIE n=1 Tax=Vitreimonas sp. TaxID=3069702 RepID=UPI002D532D97|nr:bifunctional phosphoribosyl-AMP cyclohydrolase/phosphoribosyl-ATP diphosphatase HisIE [Vitreimonas sp.]HYD88086.1 bifunctional phosphoribosyl-AMP cyclohydrolase/phosphoribosyl-ATP diphosphatase HisIE [Vitreimonas sp.]
MIEFDIDRVDFAKGGGLVCAIAQDCLTLQVLMLAWMDRAALEETIRSGEATFFSRTRRTRWRKGESSGNRLRVVEIKADCDADALLLSVEPLGPACHLGSTSCFGGASAPGLGRLGALERTIAARAAAPPSQSGTANLLAAGPKRIAQKLGEEAVEAALAGVAGDGREVCEESADLLYHLVVLLHARGLTFADVMAVLERRATAAPT